MSDESSPPPLAEWAGGTQAFRTLFEAFYAKVKTHNLLAPVFAKMSDEHVAGVAAFVTQVLGGSALYSQRGGSHAAMIARHMGRRLTPEQRRAWVTLLLETADEVGLPDDPEFRASLAGYFEWGSRLAMMNSQDGAREPDPTLPMPQWTWSSPGGPYKG